jgi:hypothetical protein
LARNLPNFRVHKILKSASEWDTWLSEICVRNNWSHTKSPVVWRECLDRGGKGMLIGDSNDFQEYAKGYYGIYSSLKSSDLKHISEENDRDFKQREQERLEELSRIKPFNITISCATSKVAYLILPDLLQGHIFGETKDIFIRLYEQTHDERLNGLKMELEDLALDSLRNVICTNNAEEAFKQADLIILLDELLEKEEPTVEIKDPIIAEYHNPYIYLGQQIDKYARDSCKVFITPFESHSRIFGLVQTFISQLKRLNGRNNVIGNSKCDELVAKSILAARLKMTQQNIRNVIVIGQSIHESHYIDIAQARITGYEGAIWATENTNWQSLVEIIADADWMQKDFPMLVTQRENFIKTHTKYNGLLSFAQSIILTLKLWMDSKHQDRSIHSAIVDASDFLSINSGICLSLPVVFENGQVLVLKPTPYSVLLLKKLIFLIFLFLLVVYLSMLIQEQILLQTTMLARLSLKLLK